MTIHSNPSFVMAYSFYFFRTFVIYLLLIIGFSFIILDQNIDDLSGQDVESTVEFVYEAF